MYRTNSLSIKAALDKEMRRNLITIPEEKYDEFMADLARRQRLNTPEELYAAIGYGGIQLSRLMIKIKDEYTKLLKEQSPAEVLQVPIKKQKSSEGVIVEGLDNCLVKFAKCCNPLPGDDIIGFITRGFGVSIHKRSCSNARAGQKYKVWSSPVRHLHLGRCTRKNQTNSDFGIEINNKGT